MVDTLPRPVVDAECYRELEMGAWQLMLMAHQIAGGDNGKLLILRDLCTNVMRRWLTDERMAAHEAAARQGVALLAERDGNIIHLKPSAQS